MIRGKQDQDSHVTKMKNIGSSSWERLSFKRRRDPGRLYNCWIDSLDKNWMRGGGRAEFSYVI